jgi:ankyrin repeat protein
MAASRQKIDELNHKLLQLNGDNAYLVRELVKQGADVDFVHPQSLFTPLVKAVMKGDIAFAKALIRNGANVNKRINQSVYRPLAYAIEYEKLDMVNLLLANGAKVDSDIFINLSTVGDDNEEFTLRVYDSFLRSGFDPSLTSPNGRTMLMIAADYYATCLLPRVIEHCDPDAQDNRGDTALHLAVQYDYSEVMDFLLHLDPTIRVDLENNHGQTPFHIAMYRGYLYGVERLLSYDIDVNTPDEDGNTPLHLAIQSRKATGPAIEYLLRSRPDTDLNARNYKEETPLHIAIKDNSLPKVQLLIRAGADLHHAVIEGRGYLEYARYSGASPQIMEEIQSRL